MASATASGFGDRAEAWTDKVGLVRDVVRQELVRRQLAEHLPDGGRALDVGCGQGTQALLLGRAGFDVTGVDPSSKLLAVAEEALAGEAPEVRARVRFVDGGLPELPGGLGDAFDVVCCHGVVMYLPELEVAIAALAGVTRPGGVVSVLSRNRAGIALRAGLSGDWQAAIDGIGARHYRNRLGVEAARGHDPTEVHDAFAAAGVALDAWYGVRLLTDHWDDAPPPSDIDAIVAAEAALGAVDPYRQVAALTHTVGRRRKTAS